MNGARSPITRKVWMGFALIVMALVLALVLSYLASGSDEPEKGLVEGLQKKGEPLADCLLRMERENPSYSEELVKRLCEGR
jgi:hypothetical protein